MFRAHKTFIALFTALSLVALQLHALGHLTEHRHEGTAAEAGCSICVEGLRQQALESPPVAQAAQVPAGFAVTETGNPHFQPQFLCLAPLFRGPPTA